jgi:tetratricopeptide (TPR) repeat protein
MISELNHEFLVCLEASSIYGRQYMHEIPRWLAVAALFTLIATSHSPAVADDHEDTDVGAYILQAEIALQREDYREAADEYRKAAELSDSPDVARQAAVMGLTYGFEREALVAAKRWHKLDRKSTDARVMLAQLSFRLGDIRTARRHFTYLLENTKESPGQKLVSLVSYLSGKGDPDEADSLMRSLARPYPDSSLAHYAVASVALNAGDHKHALERAARSIELDPEGLKPKLLYARVLLASGEPDKAIEYTASIIGDDPDPDPDARMELAILYIMAERGDDALSQVNQVQLEQPGRRDALRLGAIIHFHQGRLEAAWDDFHDLLASGQFTMEALYYLGRISDYREETDRAIRFFSEVRQGGNALSAQQRAAVLLAHRNEDLEGALDQLDAFAKASPSHAVDVLLAKAQLLTSLEHHDDALKLYDKVIDFRPDNQQAALGRSELLLSMGRLEDALAGYEAAAKRWPKSALALNAYGYTLADRTDRYREAEKLIRKALRYNATNPAIIDSLGWVLFKLGQLPEALAELERAYEGMQDHEVAAHIVETLVAMGRREEALERLVAAEELTPESPLLKKVRERLFADGL